MVVRSGTATGTVAVSPSAVFEAVTDIGRLPEWNKTIVRVLERPDVVSEGAEWRVEVKPPGMPAWTSRATTLEHDPERHRFRYRSCTDDGNPSFAIWSWQAEANGTGTTVTVSWEIHPKTFVRQVLLSRIRNRSLRHEVQESISALEAIAARR